jgi:hypothetical protein
MRTPGLSLTTSILTLLGFPLALLLINDSWVFVWLPGTIDPFFYTGYFMDLKQHLNILPGLYYGSRLPWLLLGSFIHALAAPEPASYLLRLTLLYSASFSLFATIRVLFRDNLAATITALMLAAYAPFLGAIGWDYIDGFGVVLILASSAFLTAAATSTSGAYRIFLVCAGIGIVSMVSSYLMLILLAPFQLLAYLWVNSSRRGTPFYASVGWLSLGAAIAVTALGAVNKFLTGEFLYFMPQVRVARIIGKDPARWKSLNYDWIAHATWLAIPAIAFLLSLILLSLLVYNRKRQTSTPEFYRGGAVCALQMIGVGMLFLGMEIKGYWLLQIPFYAIYLTPFAFLAIGSCLAYVTAQTPQKWAWILIPAVAIILLVPFAFSFLRLVPACSPNCVLAGRVGWLATIMFLGLAASILFRRAWLFGGGLMAFGVFNIAAAAPGTFSFPPSAADRSCNLVIFDAIQAIRPYTLDGKLRFWYNTKEPMGWVFRGVASTHIWTYRLVSEDFPLRTQMPTDPVPELQVGETMVILSSRPDVLTLAAASVSQLKARPEVLGQRHIQRGSAGFDLTFVRLLPMDAQSPQELPLSDMKPLLPDAFVKSSSSEIEVQTRQIPWSYAAMASLPAAVREHWGDCSALVKLHVHVWRGYVGLGVLAEGRLSFVSRQVVAPTPGPIDVLLEIPKLRAASDILVQSWDPPRKGLIDISSMSITPFGCPPER